MFAVIKTGGKQYRVAAEDVIRVDRVNGQPGEIVEFGEVLVVGGDAPQLGTPSQPSVGVIPAPMAIAMVKPSTSFCERSNRNRPSERKFAAKCGRLATSRRLLGRA